MDHGAKKNRLQEGQSSLSKDAECVYWQLRKVSPQCPSGISAESGLSVIKTINALNELWLLGIAESDDHAPCSLEHSCQPCINGTLAGKVSSSCKCIV